MKTFNQILIYSIILLNIYGCGDNKQKNNVGNIYINNGLKGVDIKINDEPIGLFEKYKGIAITLPLGTHKISQEMDLGKYNKFDIGSKIEFKQNITINKNNEKINVNLDVTNLELNDNVNYLPSQFIISQTKNILNDYPILKTKAFIKISKDSYSNGNTIFYNIDDKGYRWKILSNSPLYDLNNKKLENTGILIPIQNGFSIAISSTQKKDFNNIKIINDGKCFQTNINKSDKIDTFCQLETEN